MLKNLMGAIWLRVPPRFRRWSMRMTHKRFTVTAAGLVFNDEGHILLLKHRFRPGSGWGLPGGFLNGGEQPVDALRRELREEVAMEVEQVEFFSARSFRKPHQIEILFRCRAGGQPRPQSIEVEMAVWFSPESLPEGLAGDQRRLVERAAGRGANHRD